MINFTFKHTVTTAGASNVTELTVQSAPAGREASRAGRDRLELRRQADRRHAVVERQRSLQLQQHYVVARVARRSSVLGVRYDLRDAHALRVLVRITDVVHSDNDLVRRTG